MDTLMVSTDVLSELEFNTKLQNGTLSMAEFASYEVDKMCQYVDSLNYNEEITLKDTTSFINN